MFRSTHHLLLLVIGQKRKYIYVNFLFNNYVDECKWSINNFLWGEKKTTSKCQWLHDRSGSVRITTFTPLQGGRIDYLTELEWDMKLTLPEGLPQLFGNPLHRLGRDLGPEVTVKWRWSTSLQNNHNVIHLFKYKTTWRWHLIGIFFKYAVVHSTYLNKPVVVDVVVVTSHVFAHWGNIQWPLSTTTSTSFGEWK